ncbi:MAG TPA: substrate-binding domain-containing protein [Ktedonobacterales bacterium]
MDFLSTLSTFGTILGVVTILGTFLDYMLNHNSEHPNRARNLRVTTALSAIVLLVILAAQYEVTPAASLLTLMPGVPFPGSTLRSGCHVSIYALPHIPATPSQAVAHPGLAGQSLDISGSSVLYGLFAGAGRQFDAANGTTTVVGKLDSSQGLSNLAAGQSQIGLTDFYQRDDPDASLQSVHDLKDYHVAVAPLTLLVSSDLKDVVWNLTTEQIVAIFSGSITDWRMVGGPDERITVFNRPLGSGTRLNFEKYVLGSSLPKDDLRARNTQALVQLMTKTRGAIGYAATNAIFQYPGKVYPICIDGYGATTASIVSGSYVFWSYEHAYVSQPKGQALPPVVKSYLDYVCSHAFQTADLPNVGFLRISQLSPAAMQTHEEEYPAAVPCEE